MDWRWQLGDGNLQVATWMEVVTWRWQLGWRWLLGGGNPRKLFWGNILKPFFEELLVNQRIFPIGGGGRHNTPAVDDESDVVDNDDSA